MLSAALLALALLLLRKRRRYGGKTSPLLSRRLQRRSKQTLHLLSESLASERKRKAEKVKKDRRWWVRPFLLHHDMYGAWATTIQVMRNADHEKFYDTFRMTVKLFDKLLEYLEPLLTKKSWRKAVCPGERLAITLRYLASGDTFASLECYFLVAEETIGSIVFETTTIIYNALKDIVFEPLTQETWLRVAAGFESMWNVPHGVGAIDGKHVRIHAPPRSGSLYYNYKHFFSLIMLAVCDAKMKILMVDAGSSGRRGDGNVFHRSKFAKKMLQKKLNLPPPCSHDEIGDTVPFFFLGDAAFERGSHIVTPFKGTFLPPEKKLFNYRISRGRRIIENVFGLLYKRYEVFQRPIQASLACAKSIVFAACALHNLHLMDEESAEPCRRRGRAGKYHDKVKEDGSTVYGRFKNEDPEEENLIFERLLAEVEDVEQSENRAECPGGSELVELLMDYFIDHDLPWQWKAAGLA